MHIGMRIYIGVSREVCIYIYRYVCVYIYMLLGT